MDIVAEIAAHEGIRLACCLSAACARVCVVCGRKSKDSKLDESKRGQLHQPARSSRSGCRICRGNRHVPDGESAGGVERVAGIIVDVADKLASGDHQPCHGCGGWFRRRHVKRSAGHRHDSQPDVCRK